MENENVNIFKLQETINVKQPTANAEVKWVGSTRISSMSKSGK